MSIVHEVARESNNFCILNPCEIARVPVSFHRDVLLIIEQRHGQLGLLDEQIFSGLDYSELLFQQVVHQLLE